MILLGLGANISSQIGGPLETLRAALEMLAKRYVQVARVSPFYRTIAWPDSSDPPFVNAVASVWSKLDPLELLDLLKDIERKFGRVRTLRNAPRTLDLDLLDYEGRVESGPPELPHPRMQTRAFVLVPLGDVAPLWRHPVSGRTVSELISMLPQSEKMPEKLTF